jgi:sugar lactone lactonase YvrE
MVVVNTPIHDAGAVLVTGPSGYASTSAHTDTLHGLVPGAYAAAASSVVTSDSLVGTVLTGVVTGSPVMLEPAQVGLVSSDYTIRGGSGALWVGKWGSVNLAEGFTSPQLAAAGTATPADTLGAGASFRTISSTVIDSSGNMWTTDYIHQQIAMYTAAQLATGDPMPAVAFFTDKEPWGLAFDAHGNLWVSYYNGNYVAEYTASQVASWSGGISEPTPALVLETNIGPLGLAFDANGTLWVAGFDVPTVYAFDAAALAAGGTVLPTDSLVSAFLAHGSGLAFDRGGNLWIGTESGYLAGYTAAQLADTTRGEPTFAQPGPSRFDGLAFDNSGNLWLATETANVVMLSPSQLSSGTISPPARTLTAAAGERTFGLGFDAHDALLPLAPTYAVTGRSRSTVGASRAPVPPMVSRDGSRPGSVNPR